MKFKEIPEEIIEAVTNHINESNNKNYNIPIKGNPKNIETPQIFEIIPFNQIDDSNSKFYAIDRSYNYAQFYNGVAIGLYAAGYICYFKGKQIRMNDLDDPINLGKAYFPEKILVTSDEDLYAIYDELFTIELVKELLKFFNDKPENIFAYSKDNICVNFSTLLSFCQEVLETALILEIANMKETQKNDFILKDGTLRSLHIKQKYLVEFGKYLHEKGIKIIAITKQSPIKMELSYTFKQIDNYLQNELKPKYPFKENNPKRKKLCCWFEVSETVLLSSYKGNMYAKKSLTGGRGFGVFFAARLDYVEKLQNYDWVIADINIFDAIPDIENNKMDRDRNTLDFIFKELTRLTQEHYILGYPYPLVEVHNYITLKKNFKEEIINRVKFSLYKDQKMDNVDIENLFLDIHERF